MVTQLRSLPPGIHSPSSQKHARLPSRGQTQLFWGKLERTGTGSLGSKGSQDRLIHQFLASASTFKNPHSAVRIDQSSQKCSPETEFQNLLKKVSVEISEDQMSPGFFSRLFLVPKSDNSRRLVIDLSLPSNYGKIPKSKMDTLQKVLSFLKKGC